MPIPMRRPTRTRRLTIAAMVSLLAFVGVAGVGARSLWIVDSWYYSHSIGVRLEGGRFGCMHESSDRVISGITFTHFTFRMMPRQVLTVFWKFHIHRAEYAVTFPGGSLGHTKVFVVWIPLWFPLLLLLIAPVRWLIARPANTPAFPVVTDGPTEA